MTRSDRDIERMVEDWLDDEARPMPHHVLEASIEAVSRTTQVGRRAAPGFRWLNQRGLAMAMAAAVVVLALTAGPTILDNLGGLLGPQPGGPGPSGGVLMWDPFVDFRLPPDQQNPSPDRYGNPEVWGYMRSNSEAHDPELYEFFPSFSIGPCTAPLLDLCPGPHWHDPDVINLVVGYTEADHAISLHGWTDGNRANVNDAILSWRSPLTGTVIVAGTVESTQSPCAEIPADGITFSIDRDAESLEAFHLALGESREFSLPIRVEIGQRLYFINDPATDSRCDNVILRMTISSE